MKQLLTKICPTCNKLFSRSRPSVMQRQTYCSRSCAIIPRNKNGLARKAGLASVAKQAITRRSKNEIEFANLCALQFNILTNVQMFEGWDADIIIPSHKFAVLWNGAWRYKQISKKLVLVRFKHEIN